MHAPAMSVILALTAAPLLAALIPDETPGSPSEWGFRPADGKLSAVDPPGFVWRPQKDAQSYDIQVADDADFQRVSHEARDLSLYCHCPPETLGPGEHFWRFRFVGKDAETSAWSSTRSFTIDETSKPFPMPAREELLSRVPEQHPRLFVRPEGLAHFRELADGRLKDRWERIQLSCERMLKDPPDISEPLKYLPDEKRGTNDAGWRKRWWGNRTHVVKVTDYAATLAFAYMLGGDERFAAEARRLILAACAWDPKGATGYRYNDEAGMPFAYYTSRTYTWLHDFLSEEDRESIRACMAVRGKEMYDHLSGRLHIWRPYASHSNRAWHWLGEVATAFMGEVEGADDWAWFALNVFFNSYPVWNDDQGGWHEGMAYWSSYLTRVTWWLATMEPSYGIDGYEKPFFSNAGDFALYVIPPGETQGGFGDLTAGYSASRVKTLMTTFARSAQNPYWQWYVEQAGGAALPGGYMGFIFATMPDVQPEAPADLPSSVCFPGVGVAALHSDLIDRENDAAFMLKSSPMGTQSHGYESQNAFLLSVAGDPIFIRTGRRDLYGSPHHKNWQWETKSVNSILVNGQGQAKHSNKPLGEITRFSTSPGFDYLVGEAAPGYEGKLTRFTRAVLFIKPHAIVIFDALEAPETATFQWLLHSPSEMRIDGQSFLAEGNSGGAILELLSPAGLEITQTNQFDPPPQEWVKLTQWHATASTTQSASAMDFVSVIRPFKVPDGAPSLTAWSLESANALGCELQLPEGRAIVVWRKVGDGLVDLGDVATDGEAACVVLGADGQAQSAFVYDGESVTYKGEGLDVP